ncbi:hypothetical protein [Variovorax sp. Root434]|uniref:hypothetical protein n=1 Tax=Variovorax sp. Root434 TaxID=1736536 RepID=UPI0012F984A5|nr:hypothetical protein [Variovorax sp. Root434]
MKQISACDNFLLLYDSLLAPQVGFSHSVLGNGHDTLHVMHQEKAQFPNMGRVN